MSNAASSHTPPPTTLEEPWPVSRIGHEMKSYIDRLGTVWIEGEITQWSVSGGNVYGKLKDLHEDVTVSINIWSNVRSKIAQDLKQGDRVVASVKPSYWLKGGTISLQVFDMRHVGLGDLLERLERLRAQLASEGLFAPERKKPLPFLPQLIGLITGKDSDAEKDVLRNAQLRWPGVQFEVVHTAVQGEKVPTEVVAAIERLDANPAVDVIIIARGGGDFQNLLGFSDERVLRAAASAATPIVSAIGHEADRPLLDEVADLRASTPTDAAKRVVPDVTEELNRVSQARAQMSNRLSQRLQHESDLIGQIRIRQVLADSEWMITVRAEEVVRLVATGAERVEQALREQQQLIRAEVGRLRALSPQSTLNRGYAIVRQAEGEHAGSVLSQPQEAPSGQKLRLTLAGGELLATSDGPTGKKTKR